MKKLLTLVALIALCGMVRANDANQMKYVQVFANQTCTGATTGTVVDVSAYKGNAAFAVANGASTVTNYTASVVLQHATATNGTFTAVTNLAGTAVAVAKSGASAAAVGTVPIDLARLHKYVRVVATQANDTNEVAAVIIAPMKAE